MYKPALKFALALGLAALPAAAQRPQPDPSQVTPPDNTKANKNDPGPTADQQSETKEDRELAQKIRSAITSDKSLSTYAHNVKVIVQNGVVTLRGPVESTAEKAAVASKAKSAASGVDVHDELTIAPPKNQ
jgi:hyperosmotically inducible protein